jgi:hypothetical protein
MTRCVHNFLEQHPVNARQFTSNWTGVNRVSSHIAFCRSRQGHTADGRLRTMRLRKKITLCIRDRERKGKAMEEEPHGAAKGQMIALMQAGHSWQEAATMAGVQISRSAAYRLLQKARMQGEAAWQNGRHGHPAKLREPLHLWLKEYCQAAPHTPSHVVQKPTGCATRS